MPTEYQPIPAGTYKVKISQWRDPKPNSKETGFFTTVVFEIMSGDYARRKIFENLNLKHQRKIVECIAKNIRTEILSAAEVNANQNICDQELLNRELMVTISYDADGNQKRKYIRPEIHAYGDNGQTLIENNECSDDEFYSDAIIAGYDDQFYKD